MVWLATLLLWLLYFYTPYTAGANAGAPTFYIHDHGSVRFAMAQVQFTLTLVVLLLCRAGRLAQVLGLGVLAAELLQRLRYHWQELDGWVFFSALPPMVWLLVLALALAATTGALMVLVALRLPDFFAQYLNSSAGPKTSPPLDPGLDFLRTWYHSVNRWPGVLPIGAVVFFMLTLGLMAPWLYQQHQTISWWHGFAVEQLTAELSSKVHHAGASGAGLTMADNASNAAKGSMAASSGGKANLNDNPAKASPKPCSALSLRWRNRAEPLSVRIQPNALTTVGPQLKCEYLGRSYVAQLVQQVAQHATPATGQQQPEPNATPATGRQQPGANAAPATGQQQPEPNATPAIGRQQPGANAAPATGHHPAEPAAQQSGSQQLRLQLARPEVYENMVVATGQFMAALSEADVATISRQLTAANYTPLVRLPASVVYGRFFPLPPDAVDLSTPLSYFSEFPLQFITEPTGTARPFATPAGIFRLENAQLFRYELAENTTITLRQPDNGAVARFTYGADGFARPDPADLATTVVPDSDSPAAGQTAGAVRPGPTDDSYFTEFNHDLYQSLARGDGVWTIGGGPHRLELDDTNTLTLTATAAAPWLGVLLSGSYLSAFESYWLAAEFSGTEALLIDLHSFDFEQPRTLLTSHDFQLPAAARKLPETYSFSFGKAHTKQDYVAIVAKDLKAGQHFSIHGLRLYVSPWPAELVAE